MGGHLQGLQCNIFAARGGDLVHLVYLVCWSISFREQHRPDRIAHQIDMPLNHLSPDTALPQYSSSCSLHGKGMDQADLKK